MDEVPHNPPATVLPYSDRPRQGPRVWAGALILLGGLAMIVLGGCFLIGVLLIVTPMGFGAPGSGAVTLLVILYLMAFLCFAVAGYLLFLGLRGLLRILGGGGS